MTYKEWKKRQYQTNRRVRELEHLKMVLLALVILLSLAFVSVLQMYVAETRDNTNTTEIAVEYIGGILYKEEY